MHRAGVEARRGGRGGETYLGSLHLGQGLGSEGRGKGCVEGGWGGDLRGLHIWRHPVTNLTITSSYKVL